MKTMDNEDIIRDAHKKTPRRPEGIDIDSSPGHISAGKIPKKKKPRVLGGFKEKNVDEWTSKDVVDYTRYLYNRRYGTGWNLNPIASNNEIRLIEDEVTDLIGYCTKRILRDYLTYFFSSEADFFFARYNQFYFAYLRRESTLKRFLAACDPANRSEDTKEKASVKKVALVDKDIEDAFLLSEERLVLQFGILIAVNWLVFKKNFVLKDATRRVFNICSKIKNKITLVKKSTESFSPYPSWLKFQEADRLIKMIDERIDIDIAFEDIGGFEFLKDSA